MTGPARAARRRELLRIYRSLARRFGPMGWWPGETPFEVVVGAILTQNAAWRNVEQAIANLREAGVLRPRPLRDLSRARLERLIRPSGYFRVKARRLRAFLDHLFERHGGSMKRLLATPRERLREELLGVHGIGPETADSIVLYAAGKPEFVVDVYTRRVFHRHGLLPEAAGYDETKALFEEALPRETPLFNEYHALIVALGKDWCRPAPRCEGCPLEWHPHAVRP